MLESTLYPIKFIPIQKEKIWGGKEYGEKWLLSGLDDDVSLASNGFLEGNEINEIIEIYPAEFVGINIFEKYGDLFPLLIKSLDIQGRLSVQIHPNDEHAELMHGSYGKTECWYILETNPKAKIHLGFNRDMTPQELYDRCKNGTIAECLNTITPKRGDFIFIEPGTVHAAEGGILLLEIQQTSDLTYRLYDWGRENDPETARELHLDLAIDCINYKKRVPNIINEHNRGELSNCDYFKIEQTKIEGEITRASNGESCTIIYTLYGRVEISYNGENYLIDKGEIIVVPAIIESFNIRALSKESRILEIFPK